MSKLIGYAKPLGHFNNTVGPATLILELTSSSEFTVPVYAGDPELKVAENIGKAGKTLLDMLRNRISVTLSKPVYLVKEEDVRDQFPEEYALILFATGAGNLRKV